MKRGNQRKDEHMRISNRLHKKNNLSGMAHPENS